MFSAATMDIGTVELVRRREVSVVHEEIQRFKEDGVVLKGGKVCACRLLGACGGGGRGWARGSRQSVRLPH